MHRIIYILMFFVFIGELYAQKEANIWYFGDGGGLDFNDCSLDLAKPGKLPNAIASTSISDSLGNLLFYTDGDVVFNRNNDTMPNGFNLIKGGKPIEIIVIKKPLDKDIYYLFSVDPLESGNGLSFSIIDMKLDGGLGDVVSKNLILHHPVTAKLAATRHSNGFDVWLLTHEWGSSKFLAFQISNTGVNKIPVESSLGLVIDDKPMNAFGFMKFSPDGDRIASCIFGSSTFELFNFDNVFGLVSKNITVHSDDQFNYPLSIEFSCDGSKIYLSCGGNYPPDSSTSRLFQMVPEGLGLDVALSAQLIDEMEDDFLYFGKLLLGPDGRIYVSMKNSEYLGVINSPSNNHTSIGYERNAIWLEENSSNGYLPIYLHPYFNMCLSSNSPVCEGEELVIESSFVCGGIFSWSGPNNFSSSRQRIVFDKAKTQQSGLYKVEARSRSLKETESIFVMVHPLPDAEITAEGNGIYCKGEEIVLSSSYSEDYSYLWTTGETTPEITVSESGSYGLIVESDFGCIDSSSKDILFMESPEVNIMPGDTIVLCQGDSMELTLFPFNSQNTYLWNTGATGQTITVNKSGAYTAVAENSYGCTDSASCYVFVYPHPDAEILSEGGNSFCDGDSLQLSANPQGVGYDYLWSTGETDQDISVYESGEYSVIVIVSEGCRDTAYISVNKYDSPNISINNNGKNGICEGDSLILTIDTDDADLSYLWSDGSNNNMLTVKNSGDYYCIATNENGCKDTSYMSIISYPNPEVSIEPQGPINLCSGSKIFISTEDEFANYLWSTGETTQSILIESPGVYSVEVENEFGCTAIADVEITYFDIDVEFLNLDNTNLHSISIGESVEKSFMMKNVSEREIYVNSVDLLSDQGIVTVTTDPPLPTILEPDSMLKITLTSNPGNVSVYYDKLEIDITEPCRRIYTIGIRGSTEAKTVVWIPDLKEKIGTKNYEIPMLARLQSEKDLTIELDFEAVIRFSAGAYYPESYRNVFVEDNFINEYGERVISFSGENIKLTRDTVYLMEMSGTVLNGEGGYTYFYIDEFSWKENLIEIDTYDGSLVMYGICKQEISVIEQFEPAKMEVKPNPANELISVDISSDISGNYNLKIVSVIGVEIFETDWFEKYEFGKNYYRNIEYDISNIPSGVYFVIFSNPSGMISKQLIVLD